MIDTARDNRSWLEQLSSDGQVQDLALSDLREIILRSLRGVILARSNVDESFLEDVVQDSLLLILDRLNQFEGRSRFLTWAISIAVRVSMSKLRRKQWKDVSLEQMATDTNLTFDANGNDLEPETDCERKEILNKMYDVIMNELSEKQRAALLSELKGMPQDEIARQLGSNRNAVYKLTHDARKRLKRGLEAAGYFSADINEAFTT